ncbi:histidine kinase [Noviherbaspirillum cavernae]|uniref:Histidine kinase n=1 Tax=Noviherbaspirillum cavernae TaxID=2320862 RepID=A0A418WZZ5_9BURK|nr:sigma-E factor negative regulatory protein [Noviherbaspirillum cavernae]RJG05799.1 histidine kinase [Noviherbaspirillum cavernae]
MNTKEMAKEQISAFADGELSDQQTEMVLASLRQTDHRNDWELYHQIGDVLRSDDIAVELSPGFAARMAARLEMEPTIIAPAMAMQSSTSDAIGVGMPAASGKANAFPRPAKRWALSGVAAAAAVATVAFVTAPQLMVAMKDITGGDAGETSLASAAATASSITHVDSRMAQPALIATRAPEGVVLRDARIDDYLLAHQRFSPSVYSTAQYARSATFATDSNK